MLLDNDRFRRQVEVCLGEIEGAMDSAMARLERHDDAGCLDAILRVRDYAIHGLAVFDGTGVDHAP